ncbi:MAG: hypothetical protein IKO61_00585 [Lachnospiraceae bacterium]|nr:hypothetical protein [Lachnospiraceae bacterium]
MIETIENGLQLALTVVCITVAISKAYFSRSRTWAILAFFSGIWFLGDLYWVLFLVFFGDTPDPSYITDLSWFAAYLFLLLLMNSVETEKKKMSKVLLLVPLFTIGMGVYYMQWGQYLTNIIDILLMSMLIAHSIHGLMKLTERKNRKNRMLYGTVLYFCIMEYGAWTASCIFEGDTLANPYIWFDIGLSLAFVLLIVAVGKAVDNELY